MNLRYTIYDLRAPGTGAFRFEPPSPPRPGRGNEGEVSLPLPMGGTGCQPVQAGNLPAAPRPPIPNPQSAFGHLPQDAPEAAPGCRHLARTRRNAPHLPQDAPEAAPGCRHSQNRFRRAYQSVNGPLMGLKSMRFWDVTPHKTAICDSPLPKSHIAYRKS
jgi:hypothetical protein